jgi:pimeloyl-ACP methyl ester carboxylesterase
MPSVVEGAGVPLAWVERGAGPAVLLVHGIAGDAEALAPLARELAAGARVLAYDRRGYGASGAPAPYEATTVHEQAEDAAALLRAVAPGPVVACGEDLGALVVLDLLERHAGLLRGAVLVDPSLFAFVPEATEALAAERARLEEALREGGPEQAVEAWLGADADPGRIARARAAHRAFFADVAGLASWPVTRARLRAVGVPAVVLTRAGAPPHVAAAAAALADLLPAAGRASGDDVAEAVRSLL